MEIEQNREITRILREVIASRDVDESDAITSLSFILEMHSWNLSIEARKNRFGSWLSEEEICLMLSSQEILYILEALAKEVSEGHKCSSAIIFAMGQAPSRLALTPFLNLFNTNVERFDENEFYQSLVSIERLFFFDEEVTESEKLNLFLEHEILECVSRKFFDLDSISLPDLKSTFLRLMAYFSDLVKARGLQQ